MLKRNAIKIIKEEFDDELRRIVYSNHKELMKIEWELMETQNSLQKEIERRRKLSEENKKLVELIKKYDMEVNNETNKKRRK